MFTDRINRQDFLMQAVLCEVLTKLLISLPWTWAPYSYLGLWIQKNIKLHNSARFKGTGQYFWGRGQWKTNDKHSSICFSIIIVVVFVCYFVCRRCDLNTDSVQIFVFVGYGLEDLHRPHRVCNLWLTYIISYCVMNYLGLGKYLLHKTNCYMFQLLSKPLSDCTGFTGGHNVQQCK
jgi:hypothetical protein